MARQVVRGVTLPPGVTLKSAPGAGGGGARRGGGAGGAPQPVLGTLPVACRFYGHLPSQSGITTMSASGADQHFELRGEPAGGGGNGQGSGVGGDGGGLGASSSADAGAGDGRAGGGENFSWTSISKAKVLAVHPSTEPHGRGSWVATSDEAQNIVVWNHARRAIVWTIDPATLEARRHSGESQDRLAASSRNPALGEGLLVAGGLCSARLEDRDGGSRAR